MSIEPYFLHCLNEPYQIIPALKIILKAKFTQKGKGLELKVQNI